MNVSDSAIRKLKSDLTDAVTGFRDVAQTTPDRDRLAILTTAVLEMLWLLAQRHGLAPLQFGLAIQRACMVVTEDAERAEAVRGRTH